MKAGVRSEGDQLVRAREKTTWLRIKPAEVELRSVRKVRFCYCVAPQ